MRRAREDGGVARLASRAVVTAKVLEVTGLPTNVEAARGGGCTLR